VLVGEGKGQLGIPIQASRDETNEIVARFR